MSILTTASKASVLRGLDYYIDKKVLFWSAVDNNTYSGYVKGTAEEPYYVTIDIKHPKRSICNCPHAEGTLRVCKHKVALYFAVFPKEALDLIEEIEREEAEEEYEYDNTYEEVRDYVDSLSDIEVREELISILMDLG